MRRVGAALGYGVVMVMAACSGDGKAPGSTGAVAPPSAPPPGGGNALTYFEGSVDLQARTMTIVTRANGGALQPQSTLPYGTASGDVYFHTCSVSLVGTTLSGGVTAINLMGGTIGGLNAVIDSISETGATLGSGSGSGSPAGIIASYGSVAPNAQNCTSPTTWQFNLPSTTSFSFKGHADGTPPAPTGTSCKAILTANPGIASGVYTLTPAGVGSFSTYCDMTSDGGGWTLFERGAAVGTNLRTSSAVGVLTSPGQATSARLSRADDAAILEGGTETIRYGTATYGYLYVTPLQSTWDDSGYGAPSFGTIVTPNIASASLGGATFPGTRFAWPLAGMPETCLDSDGSSSECGGGLHIGTWACCGWSDMGDNAYVNNSTLCPGCNIGPANGYEVWGR